MADQRNKIDRTQEQLQKAAQLISRLKTEISNHKEQLAVANSELNRTLSKLKEMGVKNLEDASEVLDKIEAEIRSNADIIAVAVEEAESILKMRR
jgi:predicted translin family RNA/ssDNA-binding protein